MNVDAKKAFDDENPESVGSDGDDEAEDGIDDAVAGFFDAGFVVATGDPVDAAHDYIEEGDDDSEDEEDVDRFGNELAEAVFLGAKSKEIAQLVGNRDGDVKGEHRD